MARVVTGSSLGPANNMSGNTLANYNTGLVNSYLSSQGVAPSAPSSPSSYYNSGTVGSGGARPGPATPAVGTPDDSIYETTLNNNQTKFNNTQAQLANQRTNIQSQYGFDPQYANDPFTRANMLTRAANNRFNATTNSNAIRGQLYSGVLSADRGADQFAADQAMDTARRQYAAALQGNSDALLNAQTNLSESNFAALNALYNRLQKSTPDASQQPGGTYDTSGYPNLTAAPARNKGHNKPKKGKK